MANTIGELGVPVVISHIREKAQYADVVGEVIADLIATVHRAESAGVARNSIILDPGIGFGKTAEHSLTMLRNLAELTNLGFPVLVGTSRKSSIGAVLDLPVDDRLEGTAATVALAIACGADMVRVHDVKEMARVAKMSDAIVRGWLPRK
jgi:dihydropteroate synthase